MFSSEDRTNLLLWADVWYGDTTRCITQNEICGACNKKLYDNIFKVYVLRELIESAEGRLTDEEIDLLYQRLGCLINLTIET